MNFAKTVYRSLSRFPAIVRWREAFRKNIQMRYWPWYRLPPRRPGTAPAAHYKHELIVSLTSFPARIHLVCYAIYSLLKQSLKPNRLVLWLADTQFPGKERELPDELLAMKPLGLEIRWCEDIKSFKKLIPSLREWPDALIVTADDDLCYPHHWLSSIYRAWQTHPQDILTSGIHPIAFDAAQHPLPFKQWGWNPPNSRASFQNTFGSGYGTIYPPGCFHSEIFDTPKALSLSPTSDDFWFWAMAVRAGTKIRLIDENRQQFIIIPEGKHTPSLNSRNISGGNNDRCMANLLHAYPELLVRLASESREEVHPFGD